LSEGFVKVADTKDIPSSQMKTVEVVKRSVLLMLKENTTLLAMFAHMKVVL
jgi:hypothetical protein